MDLDGILSLYGRQRQSSEEVHNTDRSGKLKIRILCHPEVLTFFSSNSITKIQKKYLLPRLFRQCPGEIPAFNITPVKYILHVRSRTNFLNHPFLSEPSMSSPLFSGWHSGFDNAFQTLTQGHFNLGALTPFSLSFRKILPFLSWSSLPHRISLHLSP